MSVQPKAFSMEVLVMKSRMSLPGGHRWFLGGDVLVSARRLAATGFQALSRWNRCGTSGCAGALPSGCLLDFATASSKGISVLQHLSIGIC
jgi:hypothetical protein